MFIDVSIIRFQLLGTLSGVGL